MRQAWHAVARVTRLARDPTNERYNVCTRGPYAVTTSDPSGRNREGVPAGIVRTAREAYTRNGIVYACVAARMALFSECRFQLQSTVDRHLFGQSSLSLLEYPWPNATAGELLARMENDVSTAGNSYIRKVDPADGSDPLLVQMRPDCVTIVSRGARPTTRAGRTGCPPGTPRT